MNVIFKRSGFIIFSNNYHLFSFKTTEDCWLKEIRCIRAKGDIPNEKRECYGQKVKDNTLRRKT